MSIQNASIQNASIQNAALRIGPLLILLAVTAASGCGKTMTEAECKRVGAHLRGVWDAEATAASPTEGVVASERAKNAIKSEGDKMEADWLSQCRRELEGRTVDTREVECIFGSKTVAEIQSCATPRK